MSECSICGAEMETKRGGIRGLLLPTSAEGYECRSCGALVCKQCKQERTINAIGGSQVGCRACGGQLKSR